MVKHKIRNKKAGVIFGIVAATILFMSNLSIVETGDNEFAIRMNSAMAEYDPGSDASGWLEIYLYPHTGTPGTAFAENNSATLEAASIAYFDTDGWSTTTFPSETSFDIVIRCRFNKTNVWNGSDFIDSRSRVSLTVDGHTGVGDWVVGSDFADSDMTKVVSQNSTADDFIWINFYLNNGGSGYQISDDGQLDFSAPKIEAKY